MDNACHVACVLNHSHEAESCLEIGIVEIFEIYHFSLSVQYLKLEPVFMQRSLSSNCPFSINRQYRYYICTVLKQYDTFSHSISIFGIVFNTSPNPYL